MNQHFVDSGKERSVSCLAAFVRFEVTELSYSVIYVPLFMHLFKRYAFCLPGRGVNDVHQCLYIKSCTWISSVVLLLLLHCFHLIFLYYYTLAIALSLFSWQFSFCNFRKGKSHLWKTLILVKTARLTLSVTVTGTPSFGSVKSFSIVAVSFFSGEAFQHHCFSVQIWESNRVKQVHAICRQLHSLVTECNQWITLI